MHLSRRTLVAACLGVVALTLAAAAAAAPPSSIAVAGAAAPTSTTFTSVQSADGNTVYEAIGTHAWTGGLSGTSAVDVRFVVHSSGSLTFESLGTFTGNTPCGMATMQLEGQGSGPFPGPVTGKIRTVDDAAVSSQMHVMLDAVLFLTPGGAFISYTGDVRCG
jgi:hypothetical protein